MGIPDCRKITEDWDDARIKKAAKDRRVEFTMEAVDLARDDTREAKLVWLARQGRSSLMPISAPKCRQVPTRQIS